MNLLALRQEVLAHGFDPNLFGSSRITQFLNDAYFEICRRVEWYQDEATYDFTTSTSAVIPLPGDFMKGRSLRNTDRYSELQLVSLRDIDRSDTSGTGTPGYYAIDGPNLHLFPTPDGAYNLELRYWKLPMALVNDADTPILPDTYQRLLWYWATAECYRAEDDLGTGAQWEQSYNQLLAKFEADVRFPTTDGPSVAAGMWEQDRSLAPKGWSLWYGW